MSTDKANVKITLNTKEAELQLEELQNEMKQLIALKKKAAEAGDLKGYKQIDKELKKVTRSANQLVREHTSLEKTLKNINGASIKELREAQRTLTAQTDKLNRKTTEYTSKRAQLKLVRNEIAKINTQFKIQQSLSTRLANGFNKYFSMITAGVAAFAGIAMGVMKIKGVLDEFEETITNVYTLLDEADYIEFKGLLDEGSAQLLKDYGFAITDINKALFDTISAGIPAANSIDFLNEAAVLAMGGVSTLSVAVDGMTTILNAYDLQMSESSKVSSAFFTAQKYGKTTVTELSSSIGAAVPIASMAGVSYQELLAAASAITTKGIDTKMAMTSIKNGLQALMKPGAEATRILTRFGVPMGATQIRAAGLGFTLERLNQVIQDNPDAISKAIPNIRGLTAISALSGAGLETYHEILAKVNRDFGEGSSLSSAYAKQMSTDVQKMRSAIGARNASILELGQDLKPLFLSIIRLSTMSFRTLLKVVRAILQNKNAFKILGAAIVAYAIYLKIASRWTAISATATSVYSTIAGVLTGKIKLATIAQRAWNLVQKANPIGLVVGLLVGAGVALAGYIKKVNSLGTAQRTLRNVEKEAQKNIVEQQLKVKELLAIARDETQMLFKRKGALEELNEISPEYFGNLTLEKINSEEATKATEGYTESLLRQARVQAAKEKLIELEKKRIDDLMERNDEQVKWYQTAWNGAKSFGNASSFAMNQAASGVKNVIKSHEDYEKTKETLIGLIGIETDAINKQNAAIENRPQPGSEKPDGSGTDKDASKALLTALTKFTTEKKTILINQRAKEEITEEQFNNRMLLLEMSYLTAKREILLKNGDDTSAIDLEIANRKLSIIKERIQKEQENEKAATQKEKERIDQLKKDYEAVKQMFNEQSAMPRDGRLLDIIEIGELLQNALADELEAVEQTEYFKTLAVEQQEAERAKIRDKYQDMFVSSVQEQAKMWLDLSSQVGTMVGQMITDQEITLQDFAKNMLLFALDVLEQQLTIQIASATIQSLASPESIASFGVAGIAKAAILTGLMKAAFAVVKGVISNSMTKEHASGKYPIQGESGKIYNTSFASRPQTGTYNGPQLGIFNEVPRQPEMVIDGVTTKNINVNYPEIMRAIYNVRDGRVPQFADGKYNNSMTQYSNDGTMPVPSTDPRIIALIEANTQAMISLKHMKVYTAIEDIRKGDKNYTEIENTRGL